MIRALYVEIGIYTRLQASVCIGWNSNSALLYIKKATTKLLGNFENILSNLVK
jgi:hypothetical protein